MLILWTSADAAALKKVAGDSISKNDTPHVVHKNTGLFPEFAQEGDVVLACGSKAMQVMQDMGMVPKNRTISSMREKAIKVYGVTVFHTYDPNIINRDYSKKAEIQWDVQLVCRLIKTGSTAPILGKYTYEDSLHEVIDFVESQYAKTSAPVKLACDLETLGLDEYNPDAWIISISFTVSPGRSHVVYFTSDEKPIVPSPWEEMESLGYWEQLWVQINWLLTTPMVSLRGANWKYDSRWLAEKWGIACTNHRFDTLLVGSLLDENRSNSLKLHAKIMTPLGGYEDGMDKYDMGRLDLVPKDVLLPYAGGDTDATYQVADAEQKELLENRPLTKFYINLLHPASHAFEQMERNGVLVDVPYMHQFQTELEAEKIRLEHDLVALLPNKLKIKYLDKITQDFEDGKNPMKTTLLKEFLFTPAGLDLTPKMVTEKTKEPSTSIDHLMMFSDNPVAAAFVSLLSEHGSVAKTLSTYVIGFMKHLRSDNRWHAHYMLFRGGYGDDDNDAGAVTGRTSCKDPALQTTPKHTKWTKKIRRAIIAPPGKTILQLDYSQGELKITACVANEPTMLAAYLSGADLHSITAARLNEYTLEEFMALPDDIREALRYGGKAGNFGLIYGMSAGGYREYAKTSYGVSMTEEESVSQRDGFFSLYACLLEWHKKYRGLAHTNGYVVSPLGRVRHLPLIWSKDSDMVSAAERQAINSPIQSCLSDMMQLAMHYKLQQYGNDGAKMIMMTHDSLAFEVPVEDAEVWAKRIKNIMENLPLKELFGWDHQLQFTVDAEVSIPGDDGVYSLAGLKKLKVI